MCLPTFVVCLEGVSLPEDACAVLLHNTETILSLLRSLPNVPVLAGRVRRDMFKHIGRDLIALGRARVLERLSLKHGLNRLGCVAHSSIG